VACYKNVLFLPIFLVPAVKNSKVGTVPGNASKAQENLAKARKLIKSMRSLEKKASKSSQSSTEDNGQRLHQVAASSSRTRDKEATKRYSML